jgi:hypothetical protein
LTDATRVPPGGHDYTAEMLAIAIVEAELRGNMADRNALIDTAVAEHPRRVIDLLANLLTCEEAEYDDFGFSRLGALRWAILNPNPGRR